MRVRPPKETDPPKAIVTNGRTVILPAREAQALISLGLVSEAGNRRVSSGTHKAAPDKATLPEPEMFPTRGPRDGPELSLYGSRAAAPPLQEPMPRVLKGRQWAALFDGSLGPHPNFYLEGTEKLPPYELTEYSRSIFPSNEAFEEYEKKRLASIQRRAEWYRQHKS